MGTGTREEIARDAIIVHTGLFLDPFDPRPTPYAAPLNLIDVLRIFLLMSRCSFSLAHFFDTPL